MVIQRRSKREPVEVERRSRPRGGPEKVQVQRTSKRLPSQKKASGGLEEVEENIQRRSSSRGGPVQRQCPEKSQKNVQSRSRGD